MGHHLMGSYQRSLLAVLLAQFTRKRFAGGMAGVVRLATRSVTVQVCVLASHACAGILCLKDSAESLPPRGCTNAHCHSCWLMGPVLSGIIARC